MNPIPLPHRSFPVTHHLHKHFTRKGDDHIVKTEIPLVEVLSLQLRRALYCSFGKPVVGGRINVNLTSVWRGHDARARLHEYRVRLLRNRLLIQHFFVHFTTGITMGQDDCRVLPATQYIFLGYNLDYVRRPPYVCFLAGSRRR